MPAFVAPLCDETLGCPSHEEAASRRWRVWRCGEASLEALGRCQLLQQRCVAKLHKLGVATLHDLREIRSTDLFWLDKASQKRFFAATERRIATVPPWSANVTWACHCTTARCAEWLRIASEQQRSSWCWSERVVRVMTAARAGQYHAALTQRFRLGNTLQDLGAEVEVLRVEEAGRVEAAEW